MNKWRDDVEQGWLSSGRIGRGDVAECCRAGAKRQE